MLSWQDIDVNLESTCRTTGALWKGWSRILKMSWNIWKLLAGSVSTFKKCGEFWNLLGMRCHRVGSSQRPWTKKSILILRPWREFCLLLSYGLRDVLTIAPFELRWRTKGCRRLVPYCNRSLLLTPQPETWKQTMLQLEISIFKKSIFYRLPEKSSSITVIVSFP